MEYLPTNFPFSDEIFFNYLKGYAIFLLVFIISLIIIAKNKFFKIEPKLVALALVVTFGGTSFVGLTEAGKDDYGTSSQNLHQNIMHKYDIDDITQGSSNPNNVNAQVLYVGVKGKAYKVFVVQDSETFEPTLYRNMDHLDDDEKTQDFDVEALLK